MMSDHEGSPGCILKHGEAANFPSHLRKRKQTVLFSFSEKVSNNKYVQFGSFWRVKITLFCCYGCCSMCMTGFVL